MSLNKAIALILPLIICQFLGSCKSGPAGNDEITVMLKIDSIRVPSAIKTTTPFQIKFFSTPGSNGCYNSGASSYASHDYDLIFRIYGIFGSQTGSCPTTIDYSYYLNLSLPGVYNIRVKQPDSTFLVKQITVN